VLPVSGILRLARLEGELSFVFRRRRARKAIRRLRACYGPGASRAEIRRLARRHCAYRSAHDAVKQRCALERTEAFSGCEVSGAEHLHAALAAGHGAIVVSAHLGYVRAIKPILVSQGHRVHLVGSRREKYTPSRLEAAIRRALRLPRFSPTRYFDLDTGLNLRPLLDALARNEIVGILADGRSASALHPVPVAGRTIYLAPGAMTVARTTQAPVLPVFVVEGPGPLGLRLEISPPLPLQRSDSPSDDLQANLRLFAEVFERRIGEQPHLLCWSSRFYKLQERPPRRARVESGEPPLVPAG
jgi:lauroyl/myristoyl acyltransferase